MRIFRQQLLNKRIQFKSLATLLFFLGSIFVYGQNAASEFETDYIVDSKGLRLNCKITKIKNGRVKYRLYKKSQSYTVNLFNLKDVHLNEQSDVLTEWENQIVTPREGYAHIYIYCAEKPGTKVYYNGKHLIKIKARTFFLHEVEIGKTHHYYSKRNEEEDWLKLTPKSGEIYYIYPELVEMHPGTPIMTGSNGINDFMMVGGGGEIQLKLRNDHISELIIKSFSNKLESE